MTIIVFLMDTSASMYQRTYLGGCPTLLDVAKGAVETFVKVRQKSPESRGDRYMLLSFEDPPGNIKAGWKENLATFMSELKNLRSDGTTSLGPALKHTFDVLNINRMQTGIDTYGQGRNPFFLEPSVIIVITDGGRLTSATAVHDDLTLPMYSPIPGSELTREPFRWDQRLFSLVLRLPGTPAAERDGGLVPSDASPIDVMCEVTGGRSYAITSHRMLMQCIDSLVQKVHSGVVINFEKIGPDPLNVESRSDGGDDGEGEGKEWERFNAGGGGVGGGEGAAPGGDLPNEGTSAVVPVSNAWHSCRRLIYVPRSAQKGFAVGFWPIPENFWPDLNSPQLPPRTAHPNVKFSCLSQEPMVIENLPFDKYELEPSPLTQYILARKQPTVCWQVFVSNSYKNSDVGHPFGYLKASTNLACVNLFVMPYNYPVLLPLLEDLLKVHRQKPPTEWRALFQNYLRSMPGYYAGPLRRALTRMGVPGMQAVALVPDTLDNSLSYGVSNYLKRLKNQAKVEFERMCNEVGTKSAASKPLEGIRVVPRSPLKKDLISNPCLQDKFVTLRDQLNEFGGFTVGILPPMGKRGRPSTTNVYEIPRSCLFDHLTKLRAAFHSENYAVLDEDGRHTLPVSQMGNYQEHLKRLPAQLREIESTPLRQHMFGNPFKIDKRMMVDEADVDAGGSTSVKRGACALEPVGGGKRRPGPVPRDTIARRPPSRSPSPVPVSASTPALIRTPATTPQPSSPPSSTATAPAPVPTPIPVLVPTLVPTLPPAKSPTRVPSPTPAPAPVPTETHAPPTTVELPRPQEPKPVVPVPIDTPRALPVPIPAPVAAVVAPAVPKPEGKIVAQINGTSSDSDPYNVRAIIRELEDEKHNCKVWGILAKEIRRPGKSYEFLKLALNTLQGDKEMRKLVVCDAIKEARRLKRRRLVELMEKFVFDSYSIEEVGSTTGTAL